MKKLACLLLLLLALPLAAQLDPGAYKEMRWRMIGPFRGGRTVAAVGVAKQPNVFYIGVNNGGVWRSDDYGRIWTPIFDDQPSGSIGAIGISQSDPNIIYVGSGEGLQRPDLATGDGMYKSTDAGKTWTHLGLRDAQQIAQIVVDPADPNRLFVAVIGHPYGPNEERGIFRSADGGRSFQKVLYKNDLTGGIDVILDPSNAQTVYAALWQAQQGPWENAYFAGSGSGLFKSTDGGATWQELKGGLPSSDTIGRIGIEVSQADPKRLYAICGENAKSGGLYRSNDGGATWNRATKDERIWGRPGDFNEVRSDPKNADVVYVANVVTWKSTDGGKTFASFRGAPGGDDYHRVWINPNDSKTILIASDQGAIVSVNGGDSWSSWYNQPTAQMFHVNADNAFPYRVCGGQQESGSACVATRGDDGAITFREWHPVSVEEYGYAVPDPLDPDLIFGGKITRTDRRTGQVKDVSPKPLRKGSYRFVRTAPVVFSLADPHALFFASNTVWKTTNGGESWTEISPDLTRKTWTLPESARGYVNTPQTKVTQRGVIYALAPSPVDINTLWAGTDDGLIQVTRDGGKSWNDVTPPNMKPWAKVSILEGSHNDANEAYAAVNTIRLDELHPHIYRTRDGGKTWHDVVTGIADGATINVVREDPKRRGLLFAGSETQVWASFDDGDSWQSLRQNMPASSIRDLAIHEDDVIAGTHGRGFWILDDIEPLRQVHSGMSGVTLFKPQRAWRIRWNKNSDTPLPPDEPMGENPPDGAIIDYYLPAAATGPATLDILDGSGAVIRHYASTDPAPAPKDEGNIPWWWIRPVKALSSAAGMHRFTWDLHYPPAPGSRNAYPIAAVPHNTAPSPTSPWVMPGTYTVSLTVNGKSYSQPLTVEMDPRVKTPASDLQQQFGMSKEMYDDIAQLESVSGRVAAIRAQLRAAKKSDEITALRKRAAELSGVAGEDDDEVPPAAAPDHETLNSLTQSLRAVLRILQQADAAPTTQLAAAVEDRRHAVAEILGRSQAFETAAKAAKLPEAAKDSSAVKPKA
ncbi:MAG TPA: glycoside hydrolase [Thermoanaerobaculia bacterium]|jgi:photosystem II stability/assembly factor-like uncharacterized protein|nr:glycoside hydrolase [Thermoanaerobaculia bacterium]